MQGEGRGTELVPGDESDEDCASITYEFRFDTDPAEEYMTIHCQSSRDERNAREVYGEHIIKYKKKESIEYTEEPTEYMDPVKFNCCDDASENAAIGIDLGTSYFYAGTRKNDEVEIIASDQEYRVTPSYVAFTDSKRLTGDIEEEPDGEKILKITEAIDMLSVPALHNRYTMMI